MTRNLALVTSLAHPGRPAYTSVVTQPRMYTDLARWWPLFSGPADYAEEAPEVLELLLAASPLPVREVLELGSGGGSLSSHFKPHFRMTLSDLSSDMLAVSRELNPEWEHVQGDMRTLDLGKQFQRVLIYDAIMYMTDPASARAAIANAARHVCAGGALEREVRFVARRRLRRTQTVKRRRSRPADRRSRPRLRGASGSASRRHPGGRPTPARPGPCPCRPAYRR